MRARLLFVALLAVAAGCGTEESPGYLSGPNSCAACSGPQPPAPGPVFLPIVIRDSGFVPPDAPIRAGQLVRWINESSTFHTVTSSSGVATGPIQPGNAIQILFRFEGTFEYFCIEHPGERGTITITP